MRYTKNKNKGTQTYTKESYQATGKKGRKKEERNREELKKENNKIMNKMAISTYLSIIILNVNGLNAPIERQRVA